MDLFYREYGNKGPNLIILHGLYGSSDNWATIGKQLSHHFNVFIIDQRNHGHSPHYPQHTYTDLSDDLLHFMDAKGIDQAYLIGHSMGGKTVMTFALNHPDRTDKIVVIDIAPKSYASFSNYAILTSNHDQIIKIMMDTPVSSFQTRTEIEQYLETKLDDTQLRQFLLKNIKRSDRGLFEWRLNLKAISENLPEILDGFSGDAINSLKYNKPSIFIKGENSPYILEEDMFKTRKQFTNADFVVIPNAGHWVHAEQPVLLIKTLLYFLQG
jgi:esterase